MVRGDGVAFFQVRNGAGYFQDAVIRPGGQVESRLFCLQDAEGMSLEGRKEKSGDSVLGIEGQRRTSFVG